MFTLAKETGSVSETLSQAKRKRTRLEGLDASTTLRHTLASQFAMKGGDLYALAEILGYSNLKMMLDRWAHLSPESVQALRGVMDAMYASRENSNAFHRASETFCAG